MTDRPSYVYDNLRDAAADGYDVDDLKHFVDFSSRSKWRGKTAHCDEVFMCAGCEENFDYSEADESRFICEDCAWELAQEAKREAGEYRYFYSHANRGTR